MHVSAATAPEPIASRSHLGEYQKTGSNTALDQLIRQYIHFVYAAAHRQVRDAHLAEDVTQAVFLVLARRATDIKSEKALPGWLFRTTRYCAANAMKIERRRRAHERAAAVERTEVAMSGSVPDQSSDAEPLLAMLDSALAKLNAGDRDAVLLRYLQGQEMHEVGRMLGVNEAAARKRVTRAVEKLRGIFARQGITVASAGLGSALSAAGTQAAPVTLATTVSTAVAGSASPAAAAIVHGAIKMMMLAKATLASIAAAAVILVAGGATFVILQTRPAAPSPVNATPVIPVAAPADKFITLTITDKATGKPLPNTPVQVAWANDRTNPETDASGQLQIPLGVQQPANFGFSVALPGYSPVKVRWISQPSPDPIPVTYNLQLEKGTTIGGIVKDTDGQPIAGVGVFLIIQKASPDPHEYADIWEEQVKTGADGHWHYDLAPQKMTSIMIRLSHPGYVSDDMYGGTAQEADPDVYRTLTHLLVMHKGLSVVGRVTDQAGKPIANAAVKQGDDRWGTNYPQTRTNPRGEFKFAQADPGAMTLTVQARGYAPELQQVTVGADTGLIEIKLQPGHVVRGVVIDNKGEPIDGATVVADTWREKRTIDWRADTDADGQFEWDEAPADAVTFHVLKEGYMANRSAVLSPNTPDQDQQKVTLNPPLQVVGTVTDATTGAPIAKFRATPGQSFQNDQQPFWNRREGRQQVDGKLSMTFTEPFAQGFIRVEADGYAPLASRPLKPTEGGDAPVKLEFKMQPAAGTRVVVLSPDGSPVAGAQVTLAMKGRGARIENGRMERDSEMWTTAADGSINIPAQDEKAIVVATADSGYAILPLETLGKDGPVTIKLSPWAIVSVTFKVGSKLFAGEPVHASANVSPGADQIFYSFDCTGNSDSTGHATFDKLIAGPGSATDWKMRANGQWGGMVQGDFTAIAGQTVQVQVGGTGRPVIGRIVLPADYKGRADVLVGAQGWLMEQQAQEDYNKIVSLPYPPDWTTMSFNARRAWWQGPEVAKIRDELSPQKRQSTHRRMYTALFEADGSFRANDIPTGTYSLNVNAGQPYRRSGTNPPMPLPISGSTTVTIPPVPGGQSDEPVDVGTILLASRSANQNQTAGLTATTSPTTLPTPGSPADVFSRYQEAIAAGDATTALSLVDISHPEVEQYVHTVCQLAVANADALASAVAMMGTEQAGQIAQLNWRKSVAAQGKMLTWTIDGDHAIPAGPGARFTAQSMSRLDGQWKVNLGEYFVAIPFDTATMDKQLDRALKQLQTLTTALKSGQAKTPADATAILQRR